MAWLKRRTSWIRLQSFLTVLLCTILFSPPAADAECSLSRWQPAETRPYRGVAFPERNAQYWIFRFVNEPEAHLKLNLKARFPHARYMAYTLYSLEDDESEGFPVTVNGRIQHLEDVKIEPREGHANPYLDGADRKADDRSYEIHLIQEKIEDLQPGDEPPPNTLVMPSGKQDLALFLRIYLPDDADDPKGGVALPTITALDEESGAELPCPAAAEGAVTAEDILFSGGFDRAGILLPENTINTYRPGEFSFFSNGDCPYLTTPLIHPFLNSGLVAVLRFKAPSFPDTRAGDSFSEDDEVRYFSVCIGDWQLTTSSECISDEALKVDENGYVNLLVGPDILLPPKTKWNNLRWGWHADPVLIFRQISPRQTFENSFARAEIAFDESSGVVNLHDLVENEPDKIASDDIGDYAPIGKYCTVKNFLYNRCEYIR